MMNINGHQGGMSMSLGTTATMMEDLSEPSSPDSSSAAPFEEADLLQSTINDEVSAQLAAAGPIGVAAAAAIASSKKRKRPPHSFETNPSIRKRQQTRLLRKLRSVIEEYTTRVGQQAVILCVTPGRTHQSSNAYRVFGSQPLENVVRGNRTEIMRDLEQALAAQAPAQNAQDQGHQHELPALVIDGIPTPLDKMTQHQLRQFVPILLRYSTGRGKPHWGDLNYRPVWWPPHLPWANVRKDPRHLLDREKAQLRAFIPEMLKYSTARSKPGWGKQECCPVWWPDDVPWANVRSDVRSDEEKKKVSWTTALRSIVRNCYRHHGREDLLPEFNDDANNMQQQQQPQVAAAFAHNSMVQTIQNPDGTMSIIHIDTGPGGDTPQIVTLADGTQAQVVHAIQPAGHEASAAVQTLSEVAAGTHHLSSDMGGGEQAHGISTLAEANITTDGQIILTGPEGLGMCRKSGGDKQPCTGLCCKPGETEEDDQYVLTQMQSGDGHTIGMVSIPVSVYQTVVTSMAQLNGEGNHGNQQVQIAMAPPLAEDINHTATTIKTMDSEEEESDNEQMVVAFQPPQQQQQQPQQQKGSVPDATQAVEVMTVEPELKAAL